MGSDPKNKRFAGRSFLGDDKSQKLHGIKVRSSFSVVKASWNLGNPHTGHFTRHRYLTRDRFFEEAGNALS